MAIPKKLIYRGKAKFMAEQKEAKIIKEYRFEASGTLLDISSKPLKDL